MSEECIFCAIRDGKFPTNKVYEDEQYLGILDIKPVNPGHVLVFPKKHSRNLLDPEQETTVLFAAVKKIASAVKEATGADGINITSNNEAAAGQLIFHTHIHVIPRFTDDRLMHWDHNSYKEERDMPQMAERIRALL